MAKSQQTWNKKENEKKKIQKRNEKEQKREERKSNAKAGKSLDEMMAYVDEFGNITSTPPDPTKKKTVIRQQDIQIGVARQKDVVVNTVRQGIVTFFNDSKGYGFIKDLETQESIFVHANGLTEPIRENNKVSFEVEKGKKGPNAVDVKIVR
jgi:cold shock CspA family protein